MKAHRISLDVFEGMDGEWVDIHDRRTFGVRTRVQEAMSQGIRAWNLARLSLYVSGWSLDGDPHTEDGIDAMDDDIASYVLAEAEAHYEETRRTPAARKSTAGESGGGLRIAGVVAGDGPEGRELAS